MIVLDTDHVTVLRYPEDVRYESLLSRLKKVADQGVVLTVITVEEQVRGWLAKIRKAKSPEQQIHPYERLTNLVQFLAKWRIEAFDGAAVEKFKVLKRDAKTIGTQDLKIASITLINDALLLSANLKDFEKVPGLRVENWLE